MADAELKVSFAGPLVTFQDTGRRGHLRYGVCASGPMDRLAFDAAHAALGNPPGLTAIEVSLGGLALSCRKGPVSFAIAGGEFSVDHDGQKRAPWSVGTLREGETLTIRPGAAGSWSYLAFAGEVDAARWLGHSATHASSGFGGGALCTGQTITVCNTDIRADREGDIPHPEAQDLPIRVVIGPQQDRFAPSAIDTFLGNPYTVSDAYDRMGMRLSGSGLELNGALSIPSEPILRGSVQVSGDGIPTVLLSDHQTTGGYPKIATVISCDVDRLVQARAGQSLRFAPMSAQEAIVAVRAEMAARQAYLAQIGVARDSLDQRLMRENLIHGEVHD